MKLTGEIDHGYEELNLAKPYRCAKCNKELDVDAGEFFVLGQVFQCKTEVLFLCPDHGNGIKQAVIKEIGVVER